MKKTAILILTAMAIISCQPKEKEVKQSEKETTNMETLNRWGEFHEIQPTEISGNVIQLIGKEWMLITAGNETSFNTMTASWGALGEIWSKPVSLITVRDVRYTYEFLQENEIYTLSFFDEKYKEALTILGTKSGRDSDKVRESGLTPLATSNGSMAFAEAKLIIECKKLYAEPFKESSFTDKNLYEKIYVEGNPSMHTFYIGEILNVWVK